jgi:hypothetical protein
MAGSWTLGAGRESFFVARVSEHAAADRGAAGPLFLGTAACRLLPAAC